MSTVVALCFVTAAVILCLAVHRFILDQEERAAQVNAANKRVERESAIYSREEFRRLVVGKTPEELEELFGSPNERRTTDGQEIWVYQKRTYEEGSDWLDRNTLVSFVHGKAKRVEYRSGLMVPW